MIGIVKRDPVFSVETAVARIEWDRARGGQIVGFAIRDEVAEHAVLPKGHAWPDLTLELAGGACMRLAEAKADLTMVRDSAEEISFQVSATLGNGAVRVDQLYEIFPEGVVFCEFTLAVLADRPVRLRSACMSLPMDLRSTSNARWGYVTRRPQAFRDATRIHAFPAAHLHRRTHETADEPELLPWISLDLGWEPARLFSNHVELLLEDGVAMGSGSPEGVRTLAGDDGNGWRVRWEFRTGAESALAPGYTYTNRWGVVFGAARTRAGAEAEPARRNNLLGARIAHMGIAYVRKEATEWPWRMIQARQSPHGVAHYFSGMPSLDAADDAAKHGADTLMIHQGWMSNPGTNCEPPADYHAADPEWLRAFVKRSHDLGMRVGLYMRGTEMHAMYSSFFEDFLQRDRDGLYVDWSSPLAYGWAKASSLHFSAYSYFHFTRALRQRVGAGGFLQAHCGLVNTLLAVTTFDDLVSGEAAQQRDSLLDGPEPCAYYGMLGGCGPCLISGDAADRPLFRSARAAAYAA